MIASGTLWLRGERPETSLINGPVLGPLLEDADFLVGQKSRTAAITGQAYVIDRSGARSRLKTGWKWTPRLESGHGDRK